MTKEQIKELGFKKVRILKDQELLEEIEKKGTHRQRIAICLNPNASDDLLKKIAERKNRQLLETIVHKKRLTAEYLFQYMEISLAVAMTLEEYEDCSEEIKEQAEKYIKENI